MQKIKIDRNKTIISSGASRMTLRHLDHLFVPLLVNAHRHSSRLPQQAALVMDRVRRESLARKLNKRANRRHASTQTTTTITNTNNTTFDHTKKNTIANRTASRALIVMAYKLPQCVEYFWNASSVRLFGDGGANVMHAFNAAL